MEEKTDKNYTREGRTGREERGKIQNKKRKNDMRGKGHGRRCVR